VKPEPFVSYGQNAEDVVLHRALGSIAAGCFVEVGTHDPGGHSATRAFSDRGWSGITVAPAGRLDEVLAESGWSDQEIHFMTVNDEGVEHDILQSLDLGRSRPWVLVVESSAPTAGMMTSEVTTGGDCESDLVARGYELCLFDGIARFFVAKERADLLRADLAYPACPRDDFQKYADTIALRERQDLLTQTEHWRTIALTHWADAVSHELAPPRSARLDAELEDARKELLAMHRTVSWRVTRPLRWVRGLINLARRRR
jgi:hypothetical protein